MTGVTKDELTESLVVQAQSREDGSHVGSLGAARDLTFQELRLASLLCDRPFVEPGIEFDFLKPHLAQLLHARRDDIEKAVADMVIVADRFAAELGIDLQAAIRRRFEPTQKP